MKISVDVYTKDVDAAAAAFKAAIEAGATDVRLNSSEDWDTKEFEYVNVMFEVEHTSDVLTLLDEGPFARDRDDL
jgi:hypothetical protein